MQANPNRRWGSVNYVPALQQLRTGHMVIAYQTDRNELVGITRVYQSSEVDGCVYLTRLERIGAKVRPLKKANSKIAGIPALCPGPVRTLYEISKRDAERLLAAARTAASRL